MDPRCRNIRRHVRAGRQRLTSGQGFGIDVTARNAAGATATNYDGGLPNAVSRNVLFSEASALGGALTPSAASTAIGAARFAAGIGTGTASHAFASKATGPGSLQERASDGQATSAAGLPTEAQVPLRSARLRIANGFGSEKTALQLQVTSEYWSAANASGAWLKNTADNCTTIAAFRWPGPMCATARARRRAGARRRRPSPSMRGWAP